VSQAALFVRELEERNEPLFQASEMQVEAFFRSEPSNEVLVEHFTGRCVNEYMNMVEVAKRLLETADTTDRESVKLLGRQVVDEADHYDRVAKIVEHLTGEPLNVAAVLTSEMNGGSAKGARVLQKLGADDALGLSTYQFIAEGRAHRVWQRMAEVCEDPLIASSYQKIANDEKFHRDIGRRSLEMLATSEADRKRVAALADQMRHELYEISCMNTVEVPEARQLCIDAYGPQFSKVVV
jgi:rubrerythrin